MASSSGRHRAPRPRSGARRLLARVSAAGATLALPVAGATAASAADSGSYTVAPGDSLSRIAEKAGVSWHRLYERNRSVIGSDPDLIRVGTTLRLSGQRAARAGSGRSHALRSQAVRPVNGGFATAGYQAGGSRWANGHTGQDFAVPIGTRVLSAMSGTVVKAGWGGAFGYEVVIRHRSGSYTHYGHLSRILVSEGQPVAAGQRIARSGNTGNTTGPHLHFEVRTGPGFGTDVNPVAWLNRHGVRL